MQRFAPSLTLWALCTAAGATIAGDTRPAPEPPLRTEIKRADLSGAPDMEVISSLTEVAVGSEIPRHLHHGVETAYVIQGTRVQFPGQAPVMLETGTTIMNLRDVPHAGFKVVGDQPLKLFTVHIVDKGKPLYEWLPGTSQATQSR